MTASEQLAQFAAGSKALPKLCREYKKESATVHLKELVGGALSFYAAAAVAKTGGVHIFVAEDRDAAAYLLNDFYNLLDEKQVYFFPSSYKRSAAYGAEDAQGVVQRTAAMNAVRGFTKGYLVVCTYPEALAERVVDAATLQRDTIAVKLGDKISIAVLEDALADANFTRVDFVYEPGQYSVRGGIVDVFSYSESKPYRIDFFGDEVDSIRRFNISSQLSADKLDRVEIVPNLNAGEAPRVSFVQFAGSGATCWFYDADYVLRRVNDLRRKVLADMEEPGRIDGLLTSRNVLLRDMAGNSVVALRDNLPERPATAAVVFDTAPQPKFNKNFEMLADDMIRNSLRGYATYILSENKVQVERLENIFHQIGRGQAAVRSLSVTLHEGFVDNDLKLCLYTDHQIFDRYQRYRINGEIRRDEQMTVAELNQLRPGDYVVHIDHGVGRFDGLVKINENGKVHEAIKLVYKDGDVLFVNVHSLHRISRYKSGDGEPPKVYKLGNGAWQKLKNAAKKAVKDISRELIALYAKRKASKGFAFTPDSYLQHELEASFQWEDTPDQQTTVAAVKKDMESDQPMDRLVCGDVGFGKTEVALRAAFKCVDSGRQVMVLCPTTILAQQHYETFFERFAPFGLEVEVLSRFRTPAQQKRALKAFAEGTIDVLIGTHRLLSADVNPKNLGMVIIDEEQRFGVQHKEQLKNLREQIDVLTLSATPIPRTMQMATSGVRDMSLITTPPTGRRPVIVHVGEYDPDVVSAAIRLEVGRGGQVYYVSNRVKTIDDAVARVHEAAPEARVGVAHGKMSPREVEDVMIEFATKKIDVLIATTIVESGIDNATANTLIIEDSQRLGLAQLYQLKGRVGRSATQAYAYFMFPGELPLTEEATARLTALSEFQDLGSGMRIAMRDLEIRGAGSLMGAEQHGNLSSVGFDLFTQMLGQAVAEARGDDDAGVEAASVGINLPADYFLSEEYMPAVDQRVLVYRKLAAAEDLESIDEVQEETEVAHGELPLAGLNLFNRARIRIRGERLGLESVTLSGGRITFLGVDVPKKVAFELKTRYGAVNFPKSRKLSVPYKAGAGAGSGLGRGLDANDGTGPVAAALMLLQQLGASDDD